MIYSHIYNAKTNNLQNTDFYINCIAMNKKLEFKTYNNIIPIINTKFKDILYYSL